MKAVFAILVLMLGAAGCASQTGAAKPRRLTAISALPWRDIESGLSPSQWWEINHWEYEAYLVIDATVNFDGQLKVTRFRESFPDASWNRFADVGLDHAKLRPALAGSHLIPRAELYIVFFKRVKDGRMALIYARTSGSDPMRTEIAPEPLQGPKKTDLPARNTYFNILALAETSSSQPANR
jgi:hypothetical protein